MSPELHEIANSGIGWAAQRAQMALQINAAFQTGQVSPDEYKALLEDLIRTDALDAEADNLQVKQILVFGVSQLITLAS